MADLELWIKYFFTSDICNWNSVFGGWGGNLKKKGIFLADRNANIVTDLRRRGFVLIGFSSEFLWYESN